MPVYTKDFSELLEPTLRVVYDDTDRAWAPEWDKVFTVENSSKAAETDFSTTGLGLTQAYAEGEDVPFDTVYRGFKKVYTHLQYGLGIIITRIMYEDDQYRHMRGKSQALARSANEAIEINCANILNRAFNSSYTGGDGKELCATDHPLGGGGTYSNELSTSADLDITSFEQALIGIGDFKNERGLKYRANPQKLIVSTTDAFLAQQILKSAQLPGSNYNDINPAFNILPQGYQMMHYLTDTDAWFITTDAPNGLLFFWRRNKEFSNDSDWNSDNAKYKVTYRCIQGWTEPRCIFGSPGA